jgi:hypothetical protein
VRGLIPGSSKYHTKSVAMLISTAGPKPNIELKLSNDVIPPASDTKDLVIPIDNKLAFTVHINHIVAKVFARANLTFLSRKTYLHLWVILTITSDHC